MEDLDKKNKELLKIDQQLSSVYMESLILHSESREVSDYISGYVAKKVRPELEGCCSESLIGEVVGAGSYQDILSRGGLLRPSESLSDQVAQSFAILDATSDVLRQSVLPARLVAEHLLSKAIPPGNYCCEKHEASTSRKVRRIVTNVFLNNERKRKTSSVLEDKIRAFKRLKREKGSRQNLFKEYFF